MFSPVKDNQNGAGNRKHNEKDNHNNHSPHTQTTD